MQIKERIKKIVNRLENVSPKKKFFVIVLITFLLILLLNCLTPLIADDFSYSFCLNGKRVGTIIDVFQYQVHHYLTWGGRSVVHGIAQIFLIFPKWVFNIFNSIIYTVFTMLIYIHITGKKNVYKPSLYIFINALIWFGLPVFGQNVLWLIGSCNYLWGTTIVLLFLLPFRLSLDNIDDNESVIGTLIKSILMLLFGVVAGWTNENTAAAMIIMIIIFGIYQKLLRKKLNLWQFFGFVGAAIGFIIMIIAPGNKIRSERFVDNRGFVSMIYHRMIEITNHLVEYLLPMIILLIIISVIAYYYGEHKNKKLMKTIMYCIGCLAAVYSMILSPSFPSRSWMGPVTFLIIAIGNSIDALDVSEKFIKTILIFIIPVTVLAYSCSYYATIIDTKNINRDWNKRIEFIENEKSKGNLDLEVSRIYSYNKHSALYELNDLEKNKHLWQNTSVARYFEIKYIHAKE